MAIKSIIIACLLSLCVTPVLAKGGSTNNHGQPGIGVDAKGGAVIDPTANVKELVEAANRRQDDLRIANDKYLDAEVRHVREQAELRAQYDKLLREIDTVRQEKVREVDVLGGRTEAERSQLAIETTRKLVETTASTLASQLDSKFSDVIKRIGALELAMSEGRGKQTLSDPMTERMLDEIKSLRSDVTSSAGKGEGMDKMLAWIMSLVSALGGAGVGVYLGKKKQEPA